MNAKMTSLICIILALMCIKIYSLSLNHEIGPYEHQQSQSIYATLYWTANLMSKDNPRSSSLKIVNNFKNRTLIFKGSYRTSNSIGTGTQIMNPGSEKQFPYASNNKQKSDIGVQAWLISGTSDLILLINQNPADIKQPKYVGYCIKHNTVKYQDNLALPKDELKNQYNWQRSHYDSLRGDSACVILNSDVQFYFNSNKQKFWQYKIELISVIVNEGNVVSQAYLFSIGSA